MESFEPRSFIRNDIKLNFFMNDSMAWPEFTDGLSAIQAISDDELAQRCAGAFNNWIVQPAVLLARRGIPFTWGEKLLPDAINVVSSIDFGIRHRDVHSFILAMRADGPFPCIANYVAQQNLLELRDGMSSFFPHLPQPGLIERNELRLAMVKNISFKGDISNLDPAFRSNWFIKSLRERGIDLRIDLRSTDWSSGMKMHDYSDIDVVLAVRNLTRRDYRVKPASKLVNAWLAGVPAILGPEPAFRQLRRSDLDYLEVETPDEALLALDRLRTEPALYEAMVDNGRKRAQEFTRDAVLDWWISEINGPVYSAFTDWRKKHDIFKVLRYPIAALKHKISFRHAELVRKIGSRGAGSR